MNPTRPKENSPLETKCLAVAIRPLRVLGLAEILTVDFDTEE